MTVEGIAAVIAAALMTTTSLAAFICAVWYLDFKGPQLYCRYLGLASTAFLIAFSLGAVAGGRELGALPALIQLGVVLSSFCSLLGLASFLISFGERRHPHTGSGIMGDT